MIKGVRRKELTTENILSKISEYDIFKFYMPNSDWKLGQATYSPFRDEKTPSFLIGVRNDTLRFIDFGDTSFKGNCFEFVKVLYNIPSFYDVLKKIDSDFDLGFSNGSSNDGYKKIVRKYSQPKVVEKDRSFIQVKTRGFTHEETCLLE